MRRSASPRRISGCSTRSGWRTRDVTRSSARRCRVCARLDRTDLGLRRRLHRARVCRDVRATRARRRRVHRAEPLLPERRRGAGVGRGDRRGLPGSDRKAALRQGFSAFLGHRRDRPRDRSGGRRRALARQHGARHDARCAPSADSLARHRRLLGACAAAGRARRGARRSARDAIADRRHGRRARPDDTRSSSIACGATHVALGTVLFADPDAPSRVRDELADEIKTLGFDSLEDVVRRRTRRCCQRGKLSETLRVARRAIGW